VVPPASSKPSTGCPLAVPHPHHEDFDVLKTHAAAITNLVEISVSKPGRLAEC